MPRALVYASFYYLNIEINKSAHLSNQQSSLLEFINFDGAEPQLC